MTSRSPRRARVHVRKNTRTRARAHTPESGHTYRGFCLLFRAACSAHAAVRTRPAAALQDDGDRGRRGAVAGGRHEADGPGPPGAGRAERRGRAERVKHVQ